jgi:hypothetical protein
MSEWKGWMERERLIQEQLERQRERERERERQREEEKKALQEAQKEMLRIFKENEENRRK